MYEAFRTIQFRTEVFDVCVWKMYVRYAVFSYRTVQALLREELQKAESIYCTRRLAGVYIHDNSEYKRTKVAKREAVRSRLHNAIIIATGLLNVHVRYGKV